MVGVERGGVSCRFANRIRYRAHRMKRLAKAYLENEWGQQIIGPYEPYHWVKYLRYTSPNWHPSVFDE